MRVSSIGLLLAVLFCSVAPARADEVIDGRLGPGSLYRLARPTNWNGSLLLYAHGFVSTTEPVALPPDAELLVSLLLPQGYAVAFSSFSENGWAVKDGTQRTQQLLGIFTAKFGAPSRVYLGGASMGSLIAIKLVEQHPGWFDGVVAACALSGGARSQADYQANVRAIFDVVYPGVLPGDAGGVPEGTNVALQIALPAAGAMQANPAGALTLANVTQTPVPFASGPELVQSIVTALSGHAMSASDLLPQLHGKPYFDNRDVQYTGALPPLVLAAINASVGRFDASPAALNYMEQYYQPTGALQVPMLMLSGSRDPVAPAFHRAQYASLVAAAGQSDFLVQRTVNRYGHYVFTPTELATAFGDLVGWVEFGIKPTP